MRLDVLVGTIVPFKGAEVEEVAAWATRSGLVIAAGVVWVVVVHATDEPEEGVKSALLWLLLLLLLVLLLCSEHEVVAMIRCWLCREWDPAPASTAAVAFEVDRIEGCEWSDSPNPEIAEAPVPDSGTKKVEVVEL